MMLTMKEKLSSIWQDSLFRNSIFLILGTAVMAGLGFFFWLIAARLYSTKDIGIATTLISVMNMIAMLSLLGCDATFIRYIPHSKDPNKKINTGIILVSTAAIIFSTLFIVFVETLSPPLSFIRNSFTLGISFVFFSIMTTVNMLSDAVFVANRKAKYTLIVNTLFCLFRLILPFMFISWGALGIFTSIAVSQTIGLILSIAIMVWKFKYRPALVIDSKTLRQVGSYSIHNYISGMLNLLPATLLPVIVLNKLGAENAAFFYVAMMLGNLLYAIPWATTRAMFAESVHDEISLISNTIKSIKIISLLMIPGIIVLVFGGGLILQIFGKAYSTEGFNFLRLVAITGIALSGYAIVTSLFKVKGNPRWLIAINFSYAGTIVGMSYVLLPYGLTGIGTAWLLGHIVAGAVGYTALQIPTKVATLESA